MIKKVKYKSAAVEIHTEEIVNKTTKETVFKCTEEPHPDFRNIFTRLEKVARDILEVPDDVWTGQMKIEGVSFSYSETTNVKGAVLTGKVSLETSNSPFCFNTPHLPFGQYSPTGEAPLMPGNGVELLEKLEEETKAYMTGKKRAQVEIEFALVK